MRRLLCKLLGHEWVPARREPALVIPDRGLVIPWGRCSPSESRGMGCTRCGDYDEHEWVRDMRRRGVSV